jgi:hypothetical protein
MKTFKEYLIEVFGEKHIKEIVFYTSDYHIPISEPIIKKVFGKTIRGVGYHSTGYYNIGKLINLQGKKKSIATTTFINNVVDSQFVGIASGSGVIAALEGDILTTHFADQRSIVDNTGRRWVNLIRLSKGSDISDDDLLDNFISKRENFYQRCHYDFFNELIKIFPFQNNRWNYTQERGWEILNDGVYGTKDQYVLKVGKYQLAFLNPIQTISTFLPNYSKTAFYEYDFFGKKKEINKVIQKYISWYIDMCVDVIKNNKQILEQLFMYNMQDKYSEETIMNNINIKKLIVDINGYKSASENRLDVDVVIVNSAGEDARMVDKYKLEKDAKPGYIIYKGKKYKDVKVKFVLGRFKLKDLLV